MTPEQKTEWKNHILYQIDRAFCYALSMGCSIDLEICRSDSINLPPVDGKAVWSNHENEALIIIRFVEENQ